MRDVCPKCLHRVKPEHVAGTGQGYAQLWRCPECGGEAKMRRWLFKLPEEKTAPTPEQDRRNREKKREWERANRSLGASCYTWFNGDKGCVGCPADEANDETCGSQFVNDIADRIRKLRGEGK